MAVHFVGFKDSHRFWLAVQVFGQPDFVHRFWDFRARDGGEFDPENDFFVFCDCDETFRPRPNAYDDSAFF